jgi:hypothetical protein
VASLASWKTQVRRTLTLVDYIVKGAKSWYNRKALVSEVAESGYNRRAPDNSKELTHYGKSDTLPISRLRSVILRSEATKNLVSGKQATCRVKNETLRSAQGDIGKCDFCLNAN